jgi:hypothetical protein
MNVSDILILLGVAALLLAAFRLKKKKKGGCGCGCAGCEAACPHREKNSE